MSVASTSLDAYEKVKLTKNEEIVRDVIEVLQPCTNDQIAAELCWPIHCVTGRTNGLVKKSLVAVLDRNGVTTMGNAAKRFVIVDPSDRRLRLL